MEGRIVELEFERASRTCFKIGGVDGVDAGKDDGRDQFEAGKRSGGGKFVERDGVADLHVGGVFDVGDEIAHFAGTENFGRFFIRGEYAHFVHLESFLCCHEANERFFADFAAYDPDIDQDAAVGVVMGIEDEGAEEIVGGLFGSGDVGQDPFENSFDADARFGGDQEGIGGVDADDVFDLLFHLFWIGGGKIDFVDDGEDFEVAGDGEMDVGESLRLDALDCIDDEERPFAGGEGTGTS